MLLASLVLVDSSCIYIVCVCITSLRQASSETVTTAAAAAAAAAVVCPGVLC